MDTHLKLYATQLKQLTQTHPLHDLNAYLNPPRNMKATIFHNNKHINIINSKPNITQRNVEKTSNTYTLPSPHNTSVLEKPTKFTNTTPYDIHLSEQTFPCHMCTKPAQLRANKSPLLQSYQHTVNPETYMSQCPLCLSHTHNTNHLFNCSQVPT